MHSQTDNGNGSLKNGKQYLNDRDEMNYSCEKKLSWMQQKIIDHLWINELWI